MGIRFACHRCAKQLNIKRELAGKRGICPHCSARFRIPDHDTAVSTPITADIDQRGSEKASTVSTNAQANDVGKRHEDDQHVSVGSADTDQTESSGTVPANTNVDPLMDAVSDSPKELAEDLLADESVSTWYVRPPTGGQYGPATTEILRQWIAEGRVAATAYVWRDGWPQWRQASEVLSTAIPVDANGVAPNLPATRSPPSEREPERSERLSVHPRGDRENRRRFRSSRRVGLIAVLSVVAFALIAMLVWVIRQP